ncbi:protein-lysine N-trimethyltransferase SMYD5-like [Babylonia areolata]|uniref:protein-lysine N-trimethyltransferase SMYD5-like n=1 Tax=Babylonia areolata TaxID=304850 RepID=UPI003FD1D987
MAAAATISATEVRLINSRKGRGLFATGPFQIGEVILKEKPVVSVQFLWNAMYKYAACKHCIRSLETAQDNARRLSSNPSLELPHPECCTVDTSTYVSCPHCQEVYCSEKCREESWRSSHQTLCLGASKNDPEHPLNRLEETWRNIHYPPETSNVMILLKMSAVVIQSADRDAVLQKFSQFAHTAVNENEDIVHKMLGPQFKTQMEVLQKAVKEAKDYLGDDTFEKWETPEGFVEAMAMLGTNGQGIGTSSFAEWVKNCCALDLSEEERKQLMDFIDKIYAEIEKVSGDFLNSEGSGLYEKQSACNHSCRPNAEVSFLDKDHTLTLTALTDIQPGEEICISYLGPCYLERGRYSRQKELMDNYLFVCDCPRCLEEVNGPDETTEEEMSSEEEICEEEEMGEN